jgi:hypothetical protein
LKKFFASSRAFTALISFIVLFVPSVAWGGNWGENWGSFLWGTALALPQAIPLNSLWMLVTLSIVLAIIGAMKIRQQRLR